MAKLPNSIKNPLPCGKATYSKDNYWWTDGYNYRNELKTIHPEYNWVRYVAYVVEADKKGLRATRAGYFKIKYNNPKMKATNINTWNAIANAGYIKWDASKKTYRPTENAFKLMEIIKTEFGVEPCWNK
ncbi:MAG: hypothetical protein II304_06660 [Bacteroidales bacterium]|nr:hypothetical protein [Bacteroidales bacterium]